jgi:hypothetical protein
MRPRSARPSGIGYWTLSIEMQEGEHFLLAMTMANSQLTIPNGDNFPSRVTEKTGKNTEQTERTTSWSFHLSVISVFSVFFPVFSFIC